MKSRTRKDLVAENLPPVPTLESVTLTAGGEGRFAWPEGTDAHGARKGEGARRVPQVTVVRFVEDIWAGAVLDRVRTAFPRVRELSFAAFGICFAPPARHGGCNAPRHLRAACPQI